MGSRPWPHDPTQQAFDRLESLASTKWRGLVADLPEATQEVVLHNAMVSIPLLGVLGDNVLKTAGLGIDRFGRLRHIPPNGRDYTAQFRYLIAKVEKNLARDVAVEGVALALREKAHVFLQQSVIDDIPGDKPLDQGLGNVKKLRREIRKNLSRPGIKLRHVKAVIAECKPALDEMMALGLLSLDVVEDLGKGRTPSRWYELLERRRAIGLAPEEMEMARQSNSEELQVLMDRDVRLWQLLFQLIVSLNLDLDTAAGELSELGAT